MRRHTAADFLADALVNEHVGIYRHADGQQNTGDTRQGQCGLQHRQQRHQQHHVHREPHIGNQPEPTVVHQHIKAHRRKAHHTGLDAAIDIGLTEAGAHGTLFNNFHRGGERTGAQ